MKIGTEVEYWIVDGEGYLVPDEAILDTHECVVPEFVGSLVEIVLPTGRNSRGTRTYVRGGSDGRARS